MAKRNKVFERFKTTGVCAVCGDPFPMYEAKQRFCTPKCHRKFHRDKQAGMVEHCINCPGYAQEQKEKGK